VETKIVEVNTDFEKEIGFEFGVGPVISSFTKTTGGSSVTGVTFLGGVDVLMNPVLGLFGHAKFSQFGVRYEYSGGFNQFKIGKFGVDAGVKVHFVPEKRVVPFLLVGMDLAVNSYQSQKWESGGVKNRDITKLNDRDNKLFGGVIGGAGVTVRTDVADLTVQAQVVVGLTKLDKLATERQVPILAEIPLIVRFFRPKEKQKQRPNLIILTTPVITEDRE